MPETPETDPAADPAAELAAPAFAALARQAMAKVAAGELTFGEVLKQVTPGALPAEPERKPVATPKLPKAALDALKRLPAVFGGVAPTTARKLTNPERARLAEERQLIDAVLKPLKDRKEVGIREIAAADLDVVAVERGLVKDGTPTDANGHHAVKLSVPAPGTGKAFERRVAEGGVEVSSALLQAAHQRGLISRETYLKITSTPPVKRVFDPAKAAKAVAEDPALLRLIGQHGAQVSPPSTSIYLVDDKS